MDNTICSFYVPDDGCREGRCPIWKIDKCCANCDSKDCHPRCEQSISIKENEDGKST